MVATYAASALLAVPLVLVLGASPAVVHLAGAGHLLLSLAAYRHSRALFLALDYGLDPGEAASPPDGGQGGADGGPAPPPATPRGGRPRRRPRHVPARVREPVSVPA